ncbi:MAG TPA: hypothetical protein VGD98_17140 [Ktedonobacteraceae bacterium]
MKNLRTWVPVIFVQFPSGVIYRGHHILLEMPLEQHLSRLS